MIPPRLRSLKAHIPDLLSLGVFVGLPGWIVPVWRASRASRKFINGEVEPTIDELQERIQTLDRRVQELEETILKKRG